MPKVQKRVSLGKRCYSENLILGKGKRGASPGTLKMYDRVPLQQSAYPTGHQSMVNSSVKPFSPSDTAQPTAPGWIWTQQLQSQIRRISKPYTYWGVRPPRRPRHPFPPTGSPHSAPGGSLASWRLARLPLAQCGMSHPSGDGGSVTGPSSGDVQVPPRWAQLRATLHRPDKGQGGSLPPPPPHPPDPLCSLPVRPPGPA